jgi:radical SAM protein with 4Fe4S-binding SPASM domain
MERVYVDKQNIGKARLWRSRALSLASLDLELTERCNNDCIHCCINLPVDDVMAKEKESSTEEIKRILKEAISLDCMTVRFTGGEPLVREDFEELYIFARKQGLKVLLFTNATLINSHLVRLFSRIPPLERIEVTVYGMHQSSYETVTRVPGSFEAAWRGINLLLENKIPFVVKQALLPSNKEEIDEFEAWAATIPWMEKAPAYSMFFDLRCRRDGKRNELIRKLRFSPDQGLRIIARRKDKYIKEMKQFCSKFMSHPSDKLFSCGLGHGGCVDAYGYFQPCMMLRHPDMVYDLKKGTLEDALTGFFPKLRGMRAANPDYLNRCAKCFIRGLCEQCPAKSWMEHGTLDTPVEYCCEVGHAQARYLGLLAAEEKAWEVDDWKDRVENFAKA